MYVYVTGALRFPLIARLTPLEIEIRRILFKMDIDQIYDGKGIASKIISNEGGINNKRKKRAHNVVDRLYFKAKNCLEESDCVIGIAERPSEWFDPELLIAQVRAIPTLVIIPEGYTESEVLPFPFSMADCELLRYLSRDIIVRQISKFLEEVRRDNAKE